MRLALVGALVAVVAVATAYDHVATFEVPARGLTLRALVPAKGAAPCFLPRVSEPWRS